MNREIKFRAWDDLGKSWINWSNEMFKGIKSPNEFFEMMDANGCPVQQFTGLKDKNGKEIYEGDILLWNANPKKKLPAKHYWEVYWAEKGRWQARRGEQRGALWEKAKDHEVIGNIYENPELLNPNA